MLWLGRAYQVRWFHKVDTKYWVYRIRPEKFCGWHLWHSISELVQSLLHISWWVKQSATNSFFFFYDEGLWGISIFILEFFALSSLGLVITSQIWTLRMSSSTVPPRANLNDDQNPRLRSLIIAFIILPSIAVSVRLWSRALLPGSTMSKTPTRFWWDDWTVLAAGVRLSNPIPKKKTSEGN
jgi:hypothetical protein